MVKHIRVDPDVVAEMMPFLKNEDMTFSSFVRKAMRSYLETRKAITKGRTQFVPGRGGDAA